MRGPNERSNNKLYVNPAQIVQAAAHYCQISNAPGCCIAVFDQHHFGAAGYVYPYGLSGVPGSSPAPFNVTTDTVFEIGSVTKVFTSTLLAVAVKAGNALLTGQIGYYLNLNNNFSHSTVGSPTLDAIELVRFATHTSGMPDQPLENRHKLKDYSQQLFADEIPSHAVIEWWNNYKKSPRGCWQYSNIGFVTLGFAVTQMFSSNQGRNYNEMLANYVTGPLGMTRTGAIVDSSWPAATGCIGHWSKETGPPYRIIFDKNEPTKHTAFDLKTTGDDMLIFLSAQLAAPEGSPIWMTQQVQGKYPVCTENSETSHSVTMGLAWQITQDKQGHKVFAKNGATSQGGFEAVVIFVPDLQCGVAVLGNQYYNSKGVHPKKISPGHTAHAIIAKLHRGFALTEPLLSPFHPTERAVVGPPVSRDARHAE